jgi:hypothetical protein
VSSAAITLCVASQRVFIVVVISSSTQSGNFLIHPFTVEDFKEYQIKCLEQVERLSPEYFSSKGTIL